MIFYLHGFVLVFFVLLNLNSLFFSFDSYKNEKIDNDIIETLTIRKIIGYFHGLLESIPSNENMFPSLSAFLYFYSILGFGRTSITFDLKAS